MNKIDLSYTVQFSHAFQPIIDIDLGKVVSYEVLLRGKNKESANVIFNQIKHENLMDFDQISREKAIELAGELGLKCALNINFTPDSILFNDGYYVDRTICAARKYNIKASQLVFEITENKAIDDIKGLSKILNRLRRLGVKIAIDDFGAGYAGLTLLADIQPDQIKLDMHLIRNIDTNGPRQAIAKAISNVCLELGIEILAEGVESYEEFSYLRQIGVSQFQGNYFAYPEVEALPSVPIVPKVSGCSSYISKHFSYLGSVCNH